MCNIQIKNELIKIDELEGINPQTLIFCQTNNLIRINDLIWAKDKYKSFMFIDGCKPEVAKDLENIIANPTFFISKFNSNSNRSKKQRSSINSSPKTATTVRNSNINNNKNISNSIENNNKKTKITSSTTFDNLEKEYHSFNLKKLISLDIRNILRTCKLENLYYKGELISYNIYKRCKARHIYSLYLFLEYCFKNKKLYVDGLNQNEVDNLCSLVQQYGHMTEEDLCQIILSRKSNEINQSNNTITTQGKKTLNDDNVKQSHNIDSKNAMTGLPHENHADGCLDSVNETLSKDAKKQEKANISTEIQLPTIEKKSEVEMTSNYEKEEKIEESACKDIERSGERRTNKVRKRVPIVNTKVVAEYHSNFLPESIDYNDIDSVISFANKWFQDIYTKEQKSKKDNKAFYNIFISSNERYCYKHICNRIRKNYANVESTCIIRIFNSLSLWHKYFDLSDEEKIQFLKAKLPNVATNPLSILLSNVNEEAKKILEITNTYDIRAILLQDTFDFLTYTESKFVCHFKDNHGHLPLLFILEKFFVSGKTKHPFYDRLLYMKSHLFGIGIKSQESLEALGNYFKCSSQKIKHLSKKSHRESLPLILADHPDWRYYDALDEFIISKYNASFDFLRKSEKLNTTDDGILVLFCNANKYTLYKIGSEFIAVQNELLSHYRIANALEYLFNINSYSRDFDESLRIDLNNFIIDSNFDIPIKDILNDYCQDRYRISIYNNHYALFRKNHTYLEREIEHYLRKEIMPVHYEQLFQQFKKDNPRSQNKNSKPIYWRLCESWKIKQIGLSGYFYINDVCHYDEFQIYNQLLDLLKCFDYPVKIDELSAIYNQSNPYLPDKVIEYLLRADSDKQTVILSNGYVMLFENFINSDYFSFVEFLWEPRNPKMDKLLDKDDTFEVNLMKYINFILSNCVLPSSNYYISKDINNWLYNVRHNEYNNWMKEKINERNKRCNLLLNLTEKRLSEMIYEIWSDISKKPIEWKNDSLNDL